jgi:hypothetical protein
MARPKARYKSYLFQCGGSQNWWVKLRAAGKRVERSLGTPDKAVAELLALPLIQEHKAAMLAARQPEGVTFRRSELKNRKTF